MENVKNSQEIKNIEMQTIEPTMEEIKLYEITPNEELSITNEESEMIEKNSIEDKIESTSVDEDDIVESNDYQAELIPSSSNHFDASVAASSYDSISSSQQPQKISLSILDPIIELPVITTNDYQPDETATLRNIRKRSGIHRNRFLFKADAH